MGTDPVLSVVRRPAGQVSGWAPPCWVSTRRDMTRRVLPFSYAGASPRSAGWRCHGRCPQSYGDHFGSGDSFSDLVLGLAPEAHFLTCAWLGAAFSIAGPSKSPRNSQPAAGEQSGRRNGRTAADRFRAGRPRRGPGAGEAGDGRGDATCLRSRKARGVRLRR
jgi:hypothetical protein